MSGQRRHLAVDHGDAQGVRPDRASSRLPRGARGCSTTTARGTWTDDAPSICPTVTRPSTEATISTRSSPVVTGFRIDTADHHFKLLNERDTRTLCADLD
jgi:hypothetical protein